MISAREDGSVRARPHFLIWLSETEPMCGALRAIARENRMGPLVDRTIESLKAAHRAAESEGVGKTAYRFKAPYGAEQLMSVAAIRVRGH